MKKAASFVFLIIFTIQAWTAQPGEFINQTRFAEGPWVVRAYYADREMGQAAAAEFGPWEVNREEGWMLIEIEDEDLPRLLEMGMVVDVDDRHTQELHKRRPPLLKQGAGIPGYPCYPTVEETYAFAENAALNHPNIAEWIEAGTSWIQTQNGNEGYPIKVLRLTNESIGGDKPKLFAMGSIHAREYTTAPLLTRFAEDLINGYGTDPDITWILDYHEIHLMLIVNPDGRKIAEGGAFQRKNRNNNFCSNSSSRGIDLNRNFPFQWGGIGSSGSECNETYRGPSPSSEPETQTVINYIRSIFPDQRGSGINDPAPTDATGIFLDIHSYSQYVLWPYGFNATPAPNDTGLQTLGRKFAYFNQYRPEKASDSFTTDGTTDDFAYGDLGVAAYTFELGTSFFQSCSTYTNTILPDNLLALHYAAKVVRTPFITPAGPDISQAQLDTAAVFAGETVEITVTADDSRYRQTNGTEPTQPISAVRMTVGIPPWEALPGDFTTLDAEDGVFDELQEVATYSLDTSQMAAGRYTLYFEAEDSAGDRGAVSALFLDILDPQVAPSISGTVRRGDNFSPLAGVTISSGPFSTTTDNQGFYELLLPEGDYNLQASLSGYVPGEAQVDDLINGEHETVNFNLAPICQTFFDDFEADNAAWTPFNGWARVQEDAFSGSTSYHDSPGGNYPNLMEATLTSQSFDFSQATYVTLSFQHHYDLESGFDFGLLEYNIGGGWVSIESFTGVQNTWETYTVTVPELVGEASAMIRFRTSTDSGVGANGWYVDDVTIATAGQDCSPVSLVDLSEMWPEQVGITDLVQFVGNQP